MIDGVDQALALRRLGLSVIPVPRPGPHQDGKVPAIAWRAYQTRLPTDAEIVAWFATPMNIGIVTGAISGIVVVDCDSPDALRWWTRRRPYTAWQTKTARGFHLFYRHPGSRVANRARLESGDGRRAIDVRGDGGYVIAPGSLHASGTAYAEAGDWTEPKTALPLFWLGWVQRPRRAVPPRPVVAVRPTGLVVERARRYLAAIPRPEIGSGSDAAVLYAACKLVRGFNLSVADAEQLLWDWCGGRPGWDRAWVAAKVENAQKYGSEPIGALA